MSSIRVTCHARLKQSPQEIAAQILDLDRWLDFRGYGPLPGIRAAAFEQRTPEVVGTRIRVLNTDGSTHIEEILVWEPETRIQLRLQEFSPPLSRLALSMDEDWSFSRVADETQVVRRMAIIPRTLWSWPLLWCISWFLRGALRRHLQQLARQ